MQLTSIVEARAADDTLYHYTDTGTANTIIKSDVFRLTSDVSSKPDQDLRHGNGSFYLSTTRSVLGSYSSGHRTGTILNLDGNKLSNNYKIGAVDYWGPEFRRINPAKNEMEDRVYNHTPTIPDAINYIKSIHIMVDDVEDIHPAVKKSIREIFIIAKSNNIPTFVYNDSKNFQMQRNPIDMPIDKLKLSQDDIHKFGDKKYQRRERNYLSGLVELIKKPAGRKLSKEGVRYLYGFDYSDAHISISASLHNLKGNKDPNFITMFMRKHNINDISQLVEFLREKWKGYNHYDHQ